MSDKPMLNNFWIPVHDGENWWFTASNKQLEHYNEAHKRKLYCYSCFESYFVKTKRANFSISRVLPTGCSSCGKKPKGDILTIAKFMQL